MHCPEPGVNRGNHQLLKLFKGQGAAVFQHFRETHVFVAGHNDVLMPLKDPGGSHGSHLRAVNAFQKADYLFLDGVFPAVIFENELFAVL